MGKFVPILGPISGSIGANVFSKNKGGGYIRLKGTPTNPNSTRQQEVRNWLASESGKWAHETDEQREAWNTWAAENPLTDPLGQSYYRTGHQCFCGLNARLLDAGVATQALPPAESGPAGLETLSITYTSTTQIEVTFTPPLTTGRCLYAWMSFPQEGAGDPNFAQAVMVGYSAVEAASPVTLELPKSVQVGCVCNFWVGVMDKSGQVSVAMKCREEKTE